MYDKHGNKRQWWTQETMETFSKKAECFVQQYNNYNLTVLGNQVKVIGIVICDKWSRNIHVLFFLFVQQTQPRHIFFN